MIKGISTLFLFVMLMSCQQTKEVRKESNGKLSEKYYVLRSDKKVKHGKYVSYHIGYTNDATGKYIKESGYYKNGERDSLWIEYYPPKRSKNSLSCCNLKSEGEYKDGEKVGVWLFYKREVIKRYNYTTNQELSPLIRVNLDYPSKAIEEGVEGVVTVSYKSHDDCTISNIQIIKSLSPECDTAVIKMLERMSELMIKYGVECEKGTITKDYKFKIVD